MTKREFRPRAERRSLAQVQELLYNEYDLSRRLFNNNIYPGFIDFEMIDYVKFLDDVQSLEDLIAGLAELSPFADDALDVAESMTVHDFAVFKLALIHERRVSSALYDGESKMPHRFVDIVLPSQIFRASYVAQESRVSLGVALIRLLEVKGATYLE